eukprot:TRINITY_DN22022_c0_g1_i6.p1 TRINITY_DN22022_c0_g1~~TRINITY_DN22022_c0_g1_i6.p1  ORF type:complete len:500 (-),score=86.92 TRINITY_DN22022_c0_g1_i6:355-1854(-)
MDEVAIASKDKLESMNYVTLDKTLQEVARMCSDSPSRLDFSKVLNAISEQQLVLSRIDGATTATQQKLAGVDYAAFEQTLKDAVGVRADPLSQVDFTPVLRALNEQNVAISKIDEAVIASKAKLSSIDFSSLETKLNEIARTGADVPASVDLTPVLNALSEQKAVISKIDEAAATSNLKLMSMDHSHLGKDLNDLIGICADVKANVDLTAVLNALSEQKSVIARIDENATASREKLSSMDYCALEKTLNDLVGSRAESPSQVDLTPVLNVLSEQKLAISHSFKAILALKSKVSSENSAVEKRPFAKLLSDNSAFDKGRIASVGDSAHVQASVDGTPAQVDFTPVLNVLAEQKLAISHSYKAILALKVKLVSDNSALEKRLVALVGDSARGKASDGVQADASLHVDFSELEKKLTGLVDACAESNKKLSQFDCDHLYAELSKLRCLSEASSDALGVIAAQTDTRLPRPPETEVDLTPVLDALTEQKVAISNIESYLKASK